MAMKLVDADVLEANLTSVADSIRAKTGGTDTLAFPSGFVSAVDSIASGGGADEALAEVESILSDGYADYSYMFYTLDQMHEVPVGILQHTSNGTNFDDMFANCTNLKSVPPILPKGQSVSFNEMYAYCRQLETIEGIDISGATNITNMFVGCKALENITFNGVIKKTGLILSSVTTLTHDSLMSAINALYDWASEGSTSTYTLTIGSTNLAKLTDAEKAIATQKGWTLN